MTERDRFSFLEETRYKRRVFEHVYREQILYEYGNSSADYDFEAKIIIPTTLEKKFRWIYMEYDGNITKLTISNFPQYDDHDLSKTKPWFRELISRSEKVIEKRDKIRKLFK